MHRSLVIPIEYANLAGRLLANTIIKSEDQCWIFKGCMGSDGYGHIRLGDKVEAAHRVSYKVFKGEPSGHVMHRCDVPLCVNPNHLDLGDHAQNMADCADKGRNRAPRPGNGHLKIDKDASLEIARLAEAGMNYTQIGKTFGVTPAAVRYHHRKHQ